MTKAEGLFLGFDVGTQGTKGLVYDARRDEVVGRASRPHELIGGLPSGAAEQHPDMWIDAVRDVARELAQGGALDPERVVGVGVSGQQHGSVLLDADGRVVRPAKLWCDTTTATEAARFSTALGRHVPAGFTAPKLVWTRQQEPDNWQRVALVLLPHDYINFRLTGRATMEAGDASGTGLFDPVAKKFDERAVALVDPGLARLLPPLLEAGEPAGELSPAGADLLGLRPGIVVASGGGDNMMSAIGSGATREGIVVVSLGTSATLFCYSRRPVIDPDGAIAAFCDSTGGYLPLLCVMNATGVTEEVRAAVGSSLDEITGAAERVPPGADGLLFLPYLQGERVPNLPDATGALLGIRPGLLEPGHLFRAAIEGTMLSLASGVERMKRLGVRVRSVRAVGGGSKSALWRQVLADALNAEVTTLEEPESAALGAALQALWQAERRARPACTADAIVEGRIRAMGSPATPRPDVVAHYREQRARLEQATRALFG